MRIIDTETFFTVSNVDALEHTGSHIRVQKRERKNGKMITVAMIPMARARLIFNEREIPYPEECGNGEIASQKDEAV